MKKSIKLIIVVGISLILNLCILCACNPLTRTPKPQRSHKTIILDKSECFNEIKQYSQQSEIFFFDCDLTNFSLLEIEQVSYNISITGVLIDKKEQSHQVLDLNEQADIACVTNYKVSNSQYIYGFSIVSRVMESKADHYKNDELIYTSENKFYKRDSFTSIKDLYNNGTSNVGGANYIDISFYPNGYNSYYTSSSYLKLESNINNWWEDINILAQPVYIITWNKKYDPNNLTIHQIIDYFTDNSIYTKK